MRTRQETLLRVEVFRAPTIYIYICVLHHQHLRVPRLAWLVLNWVHLDLDPFWLKSRVLHLLSSIEARAPTIDLLHLFGMEDLR